MRSPLWRAAAGAGLVTAVIVLMALLVQHDASGDAPRAESSIRDLVERYGYLAGFALIYIEESGFPLFIAGDAFLVYVGHRLPGELPVFVLAWLGFTLAVTLGATNLYLLARRYGRSLVEHRFARPLRLTPGTLATAERWFARWGPWALIVGRHVPGLRVPLTVAAGILLLPYRVFAISIAVSSAAWAAAFLAAGAIIGEGVERLLRERPVGYAVSAVLIAAAVVALAVLRRARRHRLRVRSVRSRAAAQPPSPPAECR